MPELTDTSCIELFLCSKPCWADNDTTEKNIAKLIASLFAFIIINLQLKTNGGTEISSSVFENEIVGNFKPDGQVNLFTYPMLIVKAN